jgi:hypothetical protein
MNDQERNLRVAEKISTDFAWNGRTFREGQFVALLDGEIIAATASPEEAISILRALEPDPQRGMVMEVAHPTVDVVR